MHNIWISFSHLSKSAININGFFSVIITLRRRLSKPGFNYFTGNCIVNVVPAFTSESTEIEPLCSSTIFLQNESPSPEPEDYTDVSDFTLVLKKGSNIFSTSSSDIPQPVSDKIMHTESESL